MKPSFVLPKDNKLFQCVKLFSKGIAQTKQTMNKTLGLVLTILGAGGLIYGIIMLFTGNLVEPQSWIAAILGAIFFSSGIGLMKNAGGGADQGT